MLKVTKQGENRINLELHGGFTTQEMADALDLLIAESEGVTNGVMYYEIHEFDIPGLGAFGVEMVRIPKLFKLLGKYRKCAVVCEQAWIRKAAEIEGMFFSGMTIKGFDLAHAEDAEAWLAED